ncbi:hypothetical protein J2X61_003468 [Bacillus sp. 3255]|nr:hypothetical protein [Bacillus sp. 3255]
MEKLLHLLSEEGKLIWVCSMQDKQKLIVTGTNGEAAAGNGLQAVSDLPQHEIAGCITEGKVDLPETVNIQNKERSQPGSSGSGSAVASDGLMD